MKFAGSIDWHQRVRERKLGGQLTVARTQEQAFYKMCTYFEEIDEEQLTITDISNKMKEYLHDSDSSGYGNQYLKSRCENTTGILYLWLRVKGFMIL